MYQRYVKRYLKFKIHLSDNLPLESSVVSFILFSTGDHIVKYYEEVCRTVEFLTFYTHTSMF